MDPSSMPGGDAGSTEPNEAQKAEANEWDSVAKDLFPKLHDDTSETTTTTTVEPESTTTTTTAEPESTTTTTTVEPTSTTTTTTIDPNETEDQKKAREAEEARTAEENLPDTSARDARQIARDAQRQVSEVAKDVREKMFKDAPTVLQDADGDPINSVEDVMKLINPLTIGSEENPQGRGFTREEAGMWLLSAQQKFNKNLAEMDTRISSIAETLVDLKDQADSITYRYGELLKSDKGLRDRLWTQYDKTLVKDPATGIITDAPVSMEEFYEIALAPYAKLAESMENNNTAEQTRAAADAAKKAEADKKKERADRSDIFGRGNVDDLTDPEDKEWAEAANAVFGPKKK
jgi:hypothetical protein